MNSRPTVLSWAFSIKVPQHRLFLCKSLHSPPALRSNRQHLSAVFGGHFKQPIHN